MGSGVRVQESSLPREETPGSPWRCLGSRGQWGDVCFYCMWGSAKLVSVELWSREEWQTLKPDVLAVDTGQSAEQAAGSVGGPLAPEVTITTW